MTNRVSTDLATTDLITSNPTPRLAMPIMFTPSSSTATSWRILCDFDGTISRQDVTDALLAQYGRAGCDELEARWEAGEIGSRACLSGQIALLDATFNDVMQCLDNISIDPGFIHFVTEAQMRGVTVDIVSDGLDMAIHYILRRHGIKDITVLANHFVQTDTRTWKLDFPYYQADCSRASGNCKCHALGQLQKQQQNVLFIGDGSSDFCASGKANFVLAKDRLLSYCRQHHLPHLPFHDFYEACRLLPRILHQLHVVA